MSEGAVHKRLKYIAVVWLRGHVIDLVCIEAKYKNMKSIADACGINLKRKEVRIIECKASREDYIRDKKLMDIEQSYYKHCQFFYIMCPENVIQLEDVPKEYGLLWVASDDSVKVMRKPTKYVGKTKTRFETSLKRVSRALTNNYVFKYIIQTNNINPSK